MDGWQHVSWGRTGPVAVQRAAQLADLRTAANAGFNLMAFAHLGDLPHTLRLLTLARQRGVTVILEDVHPSEQAALLAHPHPPILNASDDANRRPQEELLALCQATPAPAYLTIGPGAGQDHARCYGLTGWIGVQVYPVPAEPIGAYWPVLTRARQLADAHGARLLANGQAYNPGERWPTAEEIRALGWMYRAAGCDALLWYAMQDTGGRVTPAVWAAVQAVMVEQRRWMVTGRPLEAWVDSGVLHARWPGGVHLALDLAAGRVLSVGAAA